MSKIRDISYLLQKHGPHHRIMIESGAYKYQMSNEFMDQDTFTTLLRCMMHCYKRPDIPVDLAADIAKIYAPSTIPQDT